MDEAVKHLSGIAHEHPDLAAAHYNLGVAYKQKDDVAHAEAELRRTIELEPHFSEAHYTLGLIYTEAGDTAKAVEQLRTAVQQRPDYAEAWFTLGSTLRSTAI